MCHTVTIRMHANPGSDMFLNLTAYYTSRSSDLDILKPSSWLIIRLQRDFLPRPLTSSRDEAEAGKQKVTFFYAKRNRTER